MSQAWTEMLGVGDQLCLRWMWTMLHFCWQGAAIGAVVLLLDRALRRRSAADRYLLHSCALLCLPICVAGTFLAVSPSSSPLDRGAATSTLISDSMGASGATTANSDVGGELSSNPAEMRSAPANAIPEATDNVPRINSTVASSTENRMRQPIDHRAENGVPRSSLTEASPVGASALNRTAATSLPWAAFGFALYLTVVACLLLRLTAAIAGGHQLRRDATPITDAKTLRQIKDLCQRLGLKTAPLVAYCERVAVPTVVGVVRPIVLLPASLMSGLDPVQFSAVVGHELAHIRRLDLLLNLAQRVVEALLFFHPVVWWISARMSSERETCCDDLVVRAGCDRMQYAGALLAVAEHCRSHLLAEDANVVMMAASGRDPSELELRIRRLMNPLEITRTRLTRAGAAAFLLIIAAAALAPAVVHSWSDASARGREFDESSSSSPAEEPASPAVANTLPGPVDEPTPPEPDDPAEPAPKPPQPIDKSESNQAQPKSKKSKPTVSDATANQFRGLQLSDLPATTDAESLSDLYRETPVGSGVYQWAPQTCFMPFDGRYSVLYVANKGLYFLRQEAEPKMIYYGPIEGDPIEMLDMEADLLQRMKSFGTAGNARITLSRMLRCGNKRLASVAVRLLEKMLTDSETLHQVSSRGRGAFQANQNLDTVINLLATHETRLRREHIGGVDSLKLAVDELEAVFESAMREIPLEQYNESGHLQGKIPAYAPIHWGPAHKGLRLGVVAKAPFTAKHGDDLHAFELVLENVSDETIRFRVGYAAEWLRADVRDEHGRKVRTEFGDVGSSLHPMVTLRRLEPGEKYHICGNRLQFTPPNATVVTNAFRRMDWLITRVRAGAGRYRAKYVLPLNLWRSQRGKGEWFGVLTSGEFSFQVAPADGQPLDPPEENERQPKSPQDKTESLDSSETPPEKPLQKLKDGRFKIRFNKTPLMDVVVGYAEEVDYSLDASVVPKAVVTHRSEKPWDFTAYRRLVMLETLKAGFYLDDSLGKNMFSLRRAADVAAERAAKMKQDEKLFGGDFSVLDYRVHRKPQANSPPGPCHVYVLKANRDLSAGQVKSRLSGELSDVIAFVPAGGRTEIHCDAYATRHQGKLRYASAGPVRKGDTLEVFHNTTMVKWNSVDPNPPVITVRGKVTDEQGRPLESVNVEYMVFGDSRFDRPIGGEIRLKSDGSYSIPIRQGGFVLSPSSFHLMVQARGFAPVQVQTKKLKIGRDEELNVRLGRGFDGLLQFESASGRSFSGGTIEVKAYNLRHSPLLSVETGAELTRIPNCGSLPLLLKVKIPGYAEKTFRDVKFVRDKITRLELTALKEASEAASERSDKKAAPHTPENAKTDQPVAKMLEHLNVRDVIYTSKGETILSLATEKSVTIREWNAATGKLLRETQLETEKHGNFFLNGSLQFSGDGKTVLAVLSGKVHLWHAANGKAKQVRLPDDYHASAAAISHDGLRLATAGALGGFGRSLNDNLEISIWNLVSGERIELTFEKSLQIHRLAFSSDASLLSAASQENGVAVWDANSGAKLHHFHHVQHNAHLKHPRGPLSDAAKKQVLAVNFHPNNKLLAASDAFGVKVWDLEKGELRHILPAAYRFGRSQLDFSPSGRHLVRSDSDKEVIVWDTEKGHVVRRIATGSACIAFSPAESHLAIGFSDRKQALSVWPMQR